MSRRSRHARHGALMALAAGIVAATAARADDRSVERQVSAGPNGEVFIDNVAGSVVVSGWDRQQVAARAELGADALRLSVSTEGNQTHIRIEGYAGRADNLIHLFEGVDGQARLTVQVPRGSQLSITGVSADIRSTGVAGAQHLQAVSGDIHADVFAAPVDVHTVNGDIRLSGNGQASHITAASVSGNVRVGQGAGDVQATSISGDLQLTLKPAGSVRLRTTSGDITIDGALAPNAMLDMNTVSGRIDLQAAAPAGLTYDVNSFSGDIRDCFGQQAEHVSQYTPGTRLSGRRGSGEASLRIRTLSGDVSICDRAPQRP
jgi:hypothetical protein